MACPFCALGLHHYASIAQVEQAFRQRVLLVHPAKRMPEFQEQAADEFKLLNATRELALRYTNPGAMPFICPGPASPNPVPIRADTGLPAYMPFGAATRWPAAGSRDRPDLNLNPNVNPNVNLNNPVAATRWPAPDQFECADQETNPADSHKKWSQRSWKWVGKCERCGATASSDYAYGAAPPRLEGWTNRHTRCPKYPNCLKYPN